MTSKPKLLVAGLAALFQLLPAHAAPVTWGGWTAVTNNTAIQTLGGYTTYGGVNFNGSTTTINNGTADVTFTGIAQNASGTAAGITIATANFDFQSTAASNSNVTSAVGSPQTWTTVLDRVIGDFNNAASINLTGLTAGSSYYVQFFSSAPDANILANSKIASGGVDSPTFGNHVSGGTKYIIGTFTADSTSQSFAITGTEPTYSALVIGVQPASGDMTPPAISSLNPADNAANVPPGANLVATFNEAIAVGSGNITLKNLTDGTQTTIAVTDATQVAVSGPTLTINPSADLLPGKAYAIQVAATAIRDTASPPNSFAGIADDTTWNFTTAMPDTTPPVWTVSWPQASQLSATSISVRAQTNENGTAYYVVVAAGAAAPLSAQVKAGNNNSNAPALKSGSMALTANTEASASATGLTANTSYDVYFVAEDAVPNLQAAPAMVSVSLSSPAGVTWGSWTDVADNAAIQTIGDYPTVGGVNFNGSTTTINNGTADVVFTGIAQNAGGTAAGVTVTTAGFDFQSTGAGNSNVSSAIGAPQTWGTVLDRVIGDFNNAATIDLTGLTVGGNYYVQFFSSAPDANILSNSKITSGSVDSPFFGSHASGGTKYIIGTFTATSTTQSFAIFGNEPTYSALVIGVNIPGSDTTPPTITNLGPADDATNVPLGANLSASFTEAIAVGSGNVVVKNLTDGTQASIAITDATQVSISGTTVTINPTADLLAGKSYAVRIDATAIRDVAVPPNNFAGIADDTTWNFATIAPDTTPPDWIANWPKAQRVSPTSMIVRARTNETGAEYYIVVPNGAPAPTSAQVKAGNDSTNAPALRSGSMALTANVEATAAVTGLTADTTYNIWFVAQDAVPNLQAAPVMVSVTLTSGPMEPFISEFVAAGSVLLDENLEAQDWIEIYNPNATPINLAGYYLTDVATNLTKWAFPPTTLTGGSYLVVFASDKNRAVAGSPLHTNFKLTSGGEYLALVKTDGTTVVSEFAPTFPVQVAGYSYGIDGLLVTSPAAYFALPTPGAINGAPGTPLLVTLSPPCATFTTSTAVTMTPSFVLAGSVIRYTTDGSEPTATSTLYPGSAVTFSSTTHLRACVFAGGSAGAIAGGHYQKLAVTSNLAGINPPGTFDSNIPLMVIENFGAGAVPNDAFSYQTARLIVFDPAVGRSSLSATPNACARVGIRRRGASSAGYPKSQYRLELRDEAGADLDLALLGLPSDSDWVLSGPYVDKALIRNPLVFDLGRTIGMKAPRVRHFELFLNTDGGELTAADYAGVYVLTEKIKQSKDRVDIAELTSADNTPPAVTGGYVMRFEPVDTHAAGSPVATGWATLEIVQPEAPTAAQKTYLGGYLDSFCATLGWARGGGANNAGVVKNNPLTGYPAYINVNSFVDLLTINELVRDQDSYVRSDYMYKDRDGKLFKGPLWDYDLCMGTGRFFNNLSKEGWQLYGSTASLNPSGSYNRGGEDNQYEPDWFVPLLRDADFRQQWIDQWFELRRYGALENAALTARINAHADPLTEAAGRNFIKWPYLNVVRPPGSVFDTPATTTWTGQIDAMKNWLTTRMAWIDGQFPTLVSFSLPSSAVSAGTNVALTAATGTIYYTTDGSDPRLPGGGVNPTATMLASGGTVTIPASRTIIARTQRSTWTMTSTGTPLGITWSAPTRMTYVVGTPASAANLIITELNYHPPAPATAAELADPTFRNDDFEFIEVRNISAGPIDLSGVAFINGITHYTLPPQVLAAGEYGVFVESLAAFRARYGNGPRVLGVYADKFSNDGEPVQLVNLAGANISTFTFNDIWYPSTDGAGATLIAVNETTAGADLSNPLSWNASAHPLGTPGMENNAINFAGWLRENFDAAALANPLLSAPQADADADGLTTLMEFALGLNPFQPDAPSLLPTGGFANVAGDNYMTLTFRRRKPGSDVTYRPLVSPDLNGWTALTTMVGTPVDNGDGTETVTFRDALRATDAPRRFLRLEVVW